LNRTTLPPDGAIEEVIAAHWAESSQDREGGTRRTTFLRSVAIRCWGLQSSRAARDFSARVAFRVLFESPTVAGLAERLLRAAERPEDLDEIAGAWRDLNGLLEEEAAAMLVQESAAEAHS